MRFILKTLLALGVVMMMGAFFLAVDGYATPERKEAFNAQVDTISDAMAETPDDSGCRRRCGSGLWHSIQTLANGVFRSAPVVLDEIMPPAPEGWERREYVEADGLLMTSEVSERPFFESGAVNRTLRDFRDAAAGKSLSSAMTYKSGERMIMIRMTSKLDNFRKADAGTYAEKQEMLTMKSPPQGASLFLRVDGHPIGVLPQFETAKDLRYPTEYRRFVFSIGHIVDGEILARASDADLVDILGRIDFAGIQAVLDEPTEQFVLGKGVEWNGERQPSEDVPAPTLAYRAHLLLLAEGGAGRSDFQTMKAIAGGRVTSWDGMAKVFGVTYVVSSDVEALLGEEPALMAVAREAKFLLRIEGARLDDTHRQALSALADRRIATQSELRAQDYWQDDWDPKAAKIIAMLPE